MSTINPIDKLFEYNLWANTQLLELCATLSEEQLQVEADGVFGRIHSTLVHLVRAEGGYLRRMAGVDAFAENVDWDNLPFDALLEHAKSSGALLIEHASHVDPTVQHTIDFDSRGREYYFFNWTVLLQALYHGIEHRTQVKVLLTKLGVDHPELAAWDYTGSLEINA